MPFTIRDIPAAMRSNGWLVGAQLMERWFTRPARTMSGDTYDFNGDQSLGSWGPDGMSRLAVLAPDIPIVAETPHSDGRGRYFSVGNASFRRYRDHY